MIKRKRHLSEKTNIRKFPFFLILLIVFSIHLYPRITIKKADKVNKILLNLQQKKLLKKQIIINEDEFNSYFQYYRKRVFSSEVKFVRIKFQKNLIKMKIIYQFNKKNFNSLLKIFGDSTIEIKGIFEIKNIKRGCFKVDIIKLYLNNSSVSNKIIRILLESLGQEYIAYLDGYCPNYNIDKLFIKKGKILLITY
jgi:hypothetical protein